MARSSNPTYNAMSRRCCRREEHLERLRYDVDTVLQLQLRSYSDESWKPVANALAEYGYGVMKGWLFTRRIYSEVARGGFGSLPRCPESWLDEDTIQELAAETVAKALYYFKFAVLDQKQVGPHQRCESGDLLRRSMQAPVRQRLHGVAERSRRS